MSRLELPLTAETVLRSQTQSETSAGDLSALSPKSTEKFLSVLGGTFYCAVCARVVHGIGEAVLCMVPHVRTDIAETRELLLVIMNPHVQPTSCCNGQYLQRRCCQANGECAPLCMRLITDSKCSAAGMSQGKCAPGAVIPSVHHPPFMAPRYSVESL